MKQILILTSIVLAATFLVGCSVVRNHKKETTSTIVTTENTSSNTNNANILDDNLEKTISEYCQRYLSSDKNHPRNLENIKDIITTQYYQSLETIDRYVVEDKDYYQSTTLKEIYYGATIESLKEIKIAALCNQSLVFNDQTSAYSLFYIFDMKYDNKKGWLINNVTKSDQ